MVRFVPILDDGPVLDAWRRPLTSWIVLVALIGAGASTVVDRPSAAMTASSASDPAASDAALRPGTGGSAATSSSPTTAAPTTAAPTTASTAAPPTTDAPPTTVPVVTSQSTVPPRPEGQEPEHCIPGTYVRGGCTHKPWAVAGRVTDRTGRPIAGICIDSNRYTPLAVTDADGRYHVDVPHTAPQPERWHDCTSDELGWKEHRAWLSAVPDATTIYDVVMEQFAGMTGIVVDVNGAPVAGACIGSARTGSDGRFRLGGVEPGERPVTAIASDCPIQYLSLPEETYRFESGQWTDVRIRVTLVGQVPPEGWLPEG